MHQIDLYKFELCMIKLEGFKVLVSEWSNIIQKSLILRWWTFSSAQVLYMI